AGRKRRGMVSPGGCSAVRREERRAQPRGVRRIAINVSAIQMRQRDFVDGVKSALGGDASSREIDIEITESVIMDDVKGNIGKLKELRAIGVGVAIDDFGTGYSSLGYLTSLPVQTLKIDRSFINRMPDDPDAMTLVSMMISMAHSLRLT